MSMILVPYESVGPFAFGATVGSILALAVEEPRKQMNSKSEQALYFGNSSLVFSLDDKLQEVTLFPESRLRVFGGNIFDQDDLHSYLMLFDHSPLEHVGLVFYPRLGLSIGGTEIGVDLSVTAVGPTRFNSVLPKFKPFRSR